MKFTTLTLLLCCSLSATVDAHSPTLILMGGSYRTCSSLDSDDCLPDKRDFLGSRQASTYQIDARVFPAILNPNYWATRDRHPALSNIKQLLENSDKRANKTIYTSSDLIELFKTVDAKTWNSLLVLEQDMILSAFEIPQFRNGQRLKEGVYLDGSVGGFDEILFRRFVQEAALRSPGKKPRIAFVTSAANNNFDAVDFYRELFEQAGAEVIWWPIDWSMNAAIFGGKACQSLPQLRQQLFSQLERERVFPDLAKLQMQACLKPRELEKIPNNVQGLFLDGGDQWLHQNTFFDTKGKPNHWLNNLRTAFQKGDLVVAGTSAGTAVQSGLAMITNGTSKHALKRGAKIYGSMPEGCDQAKRCPPNLQEDDLTYWPNAGLSLLGPLLMDTHVSERKRELRFLTLLNQVNADAGIGIDETSAVMLKLDNNAISVESFGRSGAWWFTKPSIDHQQDSYTLTAHYLAPGKALIWKNGVLLANEAIRYKAINPKSNVVTDALIDAGIRDAVWNMASKQQTGTELKALNYRIQINSMPESLHWLGPNGQPGITDLQIEVNKIPGQ